MNMRVISVFPLSISSVYCLFLQLSDYVRCLPYWKVFFYLVGLLLYCFVFFVIDSLFKYESVCQGLMGTYVG